MIPDYDTLKATGRVPRVHGNGFIQFDPDLLWSYVRIACAIAHAPDRAAVVV